MAVQNYALGTGDILGVYIEGILGSERTPAPLIPADPALPPALGYPVPVLGDGRLYLPGIPPVEVKGHTLHEVEEAIRNHYVVKEKVLSPDRTVIVTLIMRRTAETEAAFAARIQPGDTLGIYIEPVLGNSGSLPVVPSSRDRDDLPAIGVPFIVQSDGTVDLPLVGAVKIGGVTLAEAQQTVARVYKNERTLVRPEAAVMVTLIRRHR